MEQLMARLRQMNERSISFGDAASLKLLPCSCGERKPEIGHLDGCPAIPGIAPWDLTLRS